MTSKTLQMISRAALTLALLLSMALPAMAYEETLNNGVEKFKYILDGEVTNNGTSRTSNWGPAVVAQRSGLELSHGTGSIHIEASQVAAKNKKYTIRVTVSFYDGSDRDAAGNKVPAGADWVGNLIMADGCGWHEVHNEKFSKDFKLPDKTKFVTVEIDYESEGSNFSVNAKYTIGGGKAKTTKKAPAAQSYKGTMARYGAKMEYSFSGGTVTNKNAIRYGGFGMTDMNVFFDGEVAPGSTLTASCKKIAGKKNYDDVKVDIYATTTDGSTTSLKKKSSEWSATVSATVPNNAKEVTMEMTHKGRMGKFNCYVTWKVTKESSGSSSNSTSWDDVGALDRCSKCNGQFSNYYVNSFVGKVGIMCNSDTQKKSRELDVVSATQEPIYYNDYIYTGSEDFLILDSNDENDVLKIMGNSRVLLQKRLANGRDRWVVYKGSIVGKSLKRAAEPSFQMSTCTATPTGTTYVLEDDGKTSRVLLLEGSMEVVSNKTSKKQTLKPGQVAAVSVNGQISVENFDVGATAKKYGITGISTSTATSSGSEKKAHVNRSQSPEYQTNNQVDRGEVSTNSDNTIYEVAATQPQYPGGHVALSNFVKSNIKYPADAKQKGVDGIVVLQFVVEKNGSLSDIKVIRKGKLPSLDAEALRVGKLIKGFKPGLNEKNQPVRVKYTLPVQFKLP